MTCIVKRVLGYHLRGHQLSLGEERPLAASSVALPAHPLQPTHPEALKPSSPRALEPLSLEFLSPHRPDPRILLGWSVGFRVLGVRGEGLGFWVQGSGSGFNWGFHSLPLLTDRTWSVR